MLGLSGCLWEGALTSEVAALSDRLRATVPRSRHGAVVYDEGTHFRACLTVNQTSASDGQPAVSPDAGVRLLFDGWIDRKGASRGHTAADYCLDVFRREGPDGLRALNGLYNILVCESEPQTARIITSRFSILPLYYATRAGALFFAPDIRSLLASGISEPRVADEECLSWLILGRYLGNETKLRDVTLLPRGACAEWKDGRAVFDSLPVFRFDSADSTPDETLVDDVLDAFRSAVRARLDDEERIGLSLTGGFDSRLILGAISERRRPDVFAFTWGLPDNDEIRIASKVAVTVGVFHKAYVLEHEFYIERARDGLYYSDGLSLFSHGFYPHVYDEVRQDGQIGVVFNGIAVDVLLGGHFLDPEVVLSGMRGRSDLLAHYRRTLTTFTAAEFQRLFKGDGSAEYERCMDGLRKVVEAVPAEDLADVNDQFFFEIRTRRGPALAFPMVRQSVETWTPCYHQDFISTVARVRPHQRLNRRLYVQVQSRMNPVLAEIEFEKTGIPARVPSEYWQPFVEMEHRRERAHYELWKHSGKTVYVPYRHYPQNFVEWFRVYPVWREFLRRTLLGPESMLIERYFEKRALEALIDDHVEGRQNRYKQINLLVSLELFLQIFGRRNGIDTVRTPR